MLVLPATIFAQDKKHEIVLGYGVGTHYAIVEEMAGVLGIFITLGAFDIEFESEQVQFYWVTGILQEKNFQ